MDKYFTKEYVELCKNEKIYDLKHKLQKGDWFMGSYKPLLNDKGYEWDNLIEYPWLLTGDQLDEEITKICKEKKYYYTVSYSFAEDQYLWTAIITPENKSTIITNNNNPLVAKISLLIKLLGEE